MSEYLADGGGLVVGRHRRFTRHGLREEQGHVVLCLGWLAWPDGGGDDDSDDGREGDALSAWAAHAGEGSRRCEERQPSSSAWTGAECQ